MNRYKFISFAKIKLPSLNTMRAEIEISYRALRERRYSAMDDARDKLMRAMNTLGVYDESTLTIESEDRRERHSLVLIATAEKA